MTSNTLTLVLRSSKACQKQLLSDCDQVTGQKIAPLVQPREAKPKPIVPYACNFSCALSRLKVITWNSDRFIAQFAPVVISRSHITLLLVFWQSFKNLSNNNKIIIHKVTVNIIRIRWKHKVSVIKFLNNCLKSKLAEFKPIILKQQYSDFATLSHAPWRILGILSTIISTT